MIRLAYHEDPSYIPLLLRSFELWHQLENLAGERLLVNTGCLRGGIGASQVLEGSIATLRAHNLPHRLLSGPQVNRRVARLPDAGGCVVGLRTERRVRAFGTLHRGPLNRSA